MAVVGLALFIGGCTTYNEVLVAVSKSDVNRIREAARRRATFRGELEINASGVCGARALHMAINMKNPMLIDVLLQEGADPDLEAELPRQPGICESIKADVAAPGTPPLHWAMLRGVREGALAILLAGADPSKMTPDGETALELAERLAVPEVAAYLKSSAHLAARTGDFERLEKALQAGADPNEALWTSGTTPLEEALLQRHWFAVEYLLDNGGGRQATLSSLEARTAIAEFVSQRPDSRHAAQLRSLMTLEVAD